MQSFLSQLCRCAVNRANSRQICAGTSNLWTLNCLSPFQVGRLSFSESMLFASLFLPSGVYFFTLFMSIAGKLLRLGGGGRYQQFGAPDERNARHVTVSSPSCLTAFIFWAHRPDLPAAPQHHTLAARFHLSAQCAHSALWVFLVFQVMLCTGRWLVCILMGRSVEGIKKKTSRMHHHCAHLCCQTWCCCSNVPAAALQVEPRSLWKCSRCSLLQSENKLFILSAFIRPKRQRHKNVVVE